VECEREELPKDCVLILVSGKVQALAGLHAVRLPIWSSGDLHIKSASYRRTGGWPDLCKIDSRKTSTPSVARKMDLPRPDDALRQSGPHYEQDGELGR
jgi:hypothetical protein